MNCENIAHFSRYVKKMPSAYRQKWKKRKNVKI